MIGSVDEIDAIGRGGQAKKPLDVESGDDEVVIEGDDTITTVTIAGLDDEAERLAIEATAKRLTKKKNSKDVFV